MTSSGARPRARRRGGSRRASARRRPGRREPRRGRDERPGGRRARTRARARRRARVDGDVAPAEDALALGGDVSSSSCSSSTPRARVARQEADPDAVGAGGRQLDADRAEERVRHLDEDAGAVARIAGRPRPRRGAQVRERVERAVDRLVRRAPRAGRRTRRRTRRARTPGRRGRPARSAAGEGSGVRITRDGCFA